MGCSDLVSRAGEKYVRNAYKDLLVKSYAELCEKSSAVAAVLCENNGQKNRSWRKAVEMLWTVKGYPIHHGVHAAEIFRDLLPTPLLSGCADINSWAPACGGSRKCLARFRGQVPDEDIDADSIQRELSEVFQQRKALWPGSILEEPSVQLTLPDVQAQLGEFERYLKARAGKPDRTAFFPRTGR